MTFKKQNLYYNTNTHNMWVSRYPRKKKKTQPDSEDEKSREPVADCVRLSFFCVGKGELWQLMTSSPRFRVAWPMVWKAFCFSHKNDMYEATWRVKINKMLFTLQ